MKMNRNSGSEEIRDSSKHLWVWSASLQDSIGSCLMISSEQCCCLEMDDQDYLSGLRGLHKRSIFVKPADGSMSEALWQSSGEADSFPPSSPQPIQLKPRSTSGSPCGSPRMSPCGSPRNSPRHSPQLFRKLLMNRSIALQRRFTLAHTPR